jgi:DNA-binding transcriptional MerR regulator
MSMFKIGDFSRICRVPVSALRYYADIGLLEPAQIDSFTGYRYYSLDQLPRLNRILALKDLGLSLEQIRILMTEAVSPEEIRGMLRMKHAEIQQVVDEEQARLERVAARLKQIELEGKMPEQEIVLKSLDGQHVLALREVIPVPQHVAKLLEETCTAVMTQGAEFTGAPFVIFHDPEFKPADMDVEVVIPVGKSFKTAIGLSGGRQLNVQELPALKSVASLIHKGDFDKVGESYTALGKWIGENGYRIAGPPREIYLSPPGSESGAITEIQWPVEKA